MKPMKSWKGWLFAALLLWTQTQALLHGSEHAQEATGAAHSCALCLAVHGVDSCLPGHVNPPLLAAPALIPALATPFSFREPRFFVRGARAPPAA